MASGSFPIDMSDVRAGKKYEHAKDHKKLWDLKEELKEWCKRVEDPWDGWGFFEDQTDNAYYDGQYMGRIYLAIRLIEECFREDQPNE